MMNGSQKKLIGSENNYTRTIAYNPFILDNEIWIAIIILINQL